MVMEVSQLSVQILGCILRRFRALKRLDTELKTRAGEFSNSKGGQIQ